MTRLEASDLPRLRQQFGTHDPTTLTVQLLDLAERQARELEVTARKAHEYMTAEAWQLRDRIAALEAAAWADGAEVGRLSDEEYGRRWAKMMDIHLGTFVMGLDRKRYFKSDDLPQCVRVSWGPIDAFNTEADAYAALGRAVRAVHAAVPPIPPAAADVETRATEYANKGFHPPKDTPWCIARQSYLAGARSEAEQQQTMFREREEYLEKCHLESAQHIGTLIAQRDQLAGELERLQQWKDSAMAVESEWDEQAIAAMLGAKLGESCRRAIAREVPKLIADRDRLAGELKAAREALKPFAEWYEEAMCTHPWDDSWYTTVHNGLTVGDCRKAAAALAAAPLADVPANCPGRGA